MQSGDAVMGCMNGLVCGESESTVRTLGSPERLIRCD